MRRKGKIENSKHVYTDIDSEQREKTHHKIPEAVIDVPISGAK